ncbi:MAG: 1-(5-phosphoribosyl)-5-[(5-phosphoribosylamino)methylideneamino] imidazole-4-carboxamide isomerase [Rhodobacteraceae bacterium]|nr:1-(5-phosphoribosyl)-5-[(5-phosphoribosylamino)methylideneamino] imidazole-4-carboxamide isomerase [Paracoccaceae bacterium]
MLIFPTIQLMNRVCVSLERGDTNRPVVWHIDSVDKATEFLNAGASWIHVTDFDAIAGSDKNRDLVFKIIRQAKLPVQYGGGVRSALHAEEWIDAGVGRLVVGTLAVLNPDLVKEIAKLHPDQIVISLDIWQGKVMIHGWQEAGPIEPEDFIRAYDRVPLAGIIITDIDANIEDLDSTLEQLTYLAGISSSPVIASGVMRRANIIEKLSTIPNVEGVIVGTGLYNKSFELEDVLNAI